MADSDAFGFSSDGPSPGALSSSPPRIERRTRRRLPPTPSLPPDRRSELLPSQANPTSASSHSIGEGRSRLAGPVCCRCNSRGKCRPCVCVKQGRVCTTCLPSRTGGCYNVGIPSCSPVIGPTPVSAPPLSTTPSTTISPPRHIIATSPLPSWNSIFSLRSSILRHVPKGVRNSWADLLFHVFSAIIHNPSDLDNWQKLFLLPRCILANPPNGDRLGWRKLQEIVSSRIRKWERGDIPELWEELVSSTSSKKRVNVKGKSERRESSRESLQAINARRAKLATQAGQYRKGIQALTSEGLAPITDSSLEDMLSKHPQYPPRPSSPLTPPPFHSCFLWARL